MRGRARVCAQLCSGPDVRRAVAGCENIIASVYYCFGVTHSGSVCVRVEVVLVA